MFTIFKREVRAYFRSQIAYILIGLFILVTSLLFMVLNLNSLSTEYNPDLYYMGFILTVIVPILTMKTIAEDRKNGTEVLLISSPVSLTSIVVGKYLATMVVFTVMTGISFVYPVILSMFGKPVISEIIGGYIGFFLLGAAFIAIGIFASSLTENQIVAAIISFVSLIIMLFMQSIYYSFGGITSKILVWFSLFARYEDYSRGILDFSAVVHSLCFIAIFLFLSVRVMEKRRWS